MIGKPEAKGGSRPAKAKKSSKKKSGADRWPKGVGYASGYDDFDDYMPPAFPPSSCKGLEFKDLDLPSKTPDGTDELTKCLIRFLSDAIQDTFATLSAVHDELIKEAPSKRAKSKAKNDAARRAGESPSASSTESGKAAMSGKKGSDASKHNATLFSGIFHSIHEKCYLVLNLNLNVC